MRTIQRNYTHCIDSHVNIPVEIERREVYNIYIVYYINCLIQPNYMDWLLNQVSMITSFGAKEIHIVATIQDEKETSFRTECMSLFPGVILHCTSQNEFEYQGILKVWILSQMYNNKNDIFLYFHSKGMSRHPCYAYNKHDNYNVILRDINYIKEIFDIFPTIDKVGYFSGGIGWIWYNFWYARGSYLFCLERPIRTERRYYYEDWLARIVQSEEDKQCQQERDFHTYYPNTLLSCYQISRDKSDHGNIGSYYCPNRNDIFYI